MTIEKPILTGQLLLAMPAMGDSRFERAVIYICAHDKGGAMGLVVNHVLPGLEFGPLLKQLNLLSDIRIPDHVFNKPVISGGPVETARGFLLHSHDFKHSDTVSINESFGITGTVDALKQIAGGHIPENMIFALGYAGWGAGQLDKELHENAWLTCPASEELIFRTKKSDMWGQALRTIGVDPALLSSSAGRA